MLENLYLSNGYLDMAQIIETGFPFIFLPAARGTGKTYGTLKYFFEKDEEILLIRRLQSEADIQSSQAGCSYKAIYDDAGVSEYTFQGDKKGLREVVYNDGSEWHGSAYMGALSTFATKRGISMPEIKHIVFDEFIAEPHVRPIKSEGMALANLYETVNRNRELTGEDPLQLICLSNSVNMNNDIFIYFGLIDHAEQMLRTGEEVRAIGNKLLIIPQNSPISAKKQKTALYEAVNAEFAEMAIKNKFILNDFSYVKPRKLSEYKCLYRVGELYVYRHKSNHEYYVTFTRGETKKIYSSGYADLTRFQREQYRFRAYYYDGLIRFESYHAIALFEKYFTIN